MSANEYNWVQSSLYVGFIALKDNLPDVSWLCPDLWTDLNLDQLYLIWDTQQSSSKANVASSLAVTDSSHLGNCVNMPRGDPNQIRLLRSQVLFGYDGGWHVPWNHSSTHQLVSFRRYGKGDHVVLRNPELCWDSWISSRLWHKLHERTRWAECMAMVSLERASLENTT